jgi:hypothetical protein
LRFQVYAANAGTGTITANADPTKMIPDSNRSNNTKTVSVAVK